ncbi:MAG: threonine synthase [Muribaculaceae bacterium]|nr:threonine synthase [Muribaculaceae bacterium]
MLYHSTLNHQHTATLEQAVTKGLAPDGGLYMPDSLPRLPRAFLRNMSAMTLQEVAYAIASTALSGDVPADVLHEIVFDAFDFDIPLVKTSSGNYVLELFHGPTMAFKDVGTRFMARLLDYYRRRHPEWSTLNVLVPTSGDTGSAVANSFWQMPGVRVYVLYPRGTVGKIQKAQFATLGGNVTAVEVNGSFDDCKSLVESAFMDEELNDAMRLTSAMSINYARIIPQMVYYFWAYVQLVRQRADTAHLVFAVPCSNLGNLASGLMAQAMGLPVKRFISVENQNNIFYNYVKSGVFTPKPTQYSIAPALDAGCPNNFGRIVDLLGSHENICRHIHAYSYDDNQIIETIERTYASEGYLLDPHSAVAYRALGEDVQPGETAIALATAHPAKLKNLMERIVNAPIALPPQLSRFVGRQLQISKMSNGFTAFKRLLLDNAQREVNPSINL